jgi:hypothetical protein
MKNNNNHFLTIILFAILWAAPVFGYVRCVYKFCKCDFEPSYKAESIYGIGTFTGLGAIIGYFNIGK